MESVFKNISLISMAPFGSRVVGCAKKDSDYDYLVLVKSKPTIHDMRGTGFDPDSGDPLYGKYFSSWRKGDVNLVFTNSKQYYDVTIEACLFCTKYKVYDKAERCMIHERFKGSIIEGTFYLFPKGNL